MSAPDFRVSVRSLVAFTVFPPDITPLSPDLMELSRRAHVSRQEESGAEAEVMLSWKGEVEGHEVTVTGRMDLFDGTQDPPLIEEIKLSSSKTLAEPYKEHLLQAVCYGFMLCERDGLKSVRLRVGYADTAGRLTAKFEEDWGYERLRSSFFDLLLPCLRWQMLLAERVKARDESLASLPFPYPVYRPEQYEMAAQVYTAIQRRRRLFAVMPTGTGKSAAVLYPALKALSLNLTGKVFCLTARGTQRVSMQKELQNMRALGLKMQALTLNARESGMDETKRKDFLSAFTADDDPLLGLCVLGGVFAEGVDLPGKALTAVAIVGIGLPQVNEERDSFKDRMETALGDGFAYAYRYPGMHKVLQAAGRLIRSDTDRGFSS